MSTLRQITATATLATVVALSASASAEAAVPCFKTFNGPGMGWQVKSNGSMSGSVHDGGSALDANHGRLVVGGVAYPEVAGNQCTQSTIAMTMPARSLGGYTVSRTIIATGGTIRWLDTITNQGGGKNVSVDFGLEVLGSQVLETSESGNASANEDDHWTIHKSGSLYSMHRWGQNGAPAQPAVEPEDGSAAWQADFGTMDDDATLRYSFYMGAGQSVRLLHGAGTAKSMPEAQTAVASHGQLFEGLTRATVDDIVNFSSDPDGDGVSKFVDDCPSIKALTANGCPGAIEPPAPAEPIDPDAAPGVQPGSEGTQPSGGAATDTVAPGVTIRQAGSKLRRSQLTGRKGAQASVSCTEACRFTLKVAVKRRGSKKEKVVRTLTRSEFSAESRALRLKIKSPELRRLAKQRVTLIVTATDQAGNSRTVRRTIGLR
jgi:hypothetical protein